LSPEPAPLVEIVAGDELSRRLAPRSHLRPDGTVASNAYKINGKPDPEPSVDHARLSTPQQTAARAGRPGFVVGVLGVGEVLASGFRVRHRPTPDNPAHCTIDGNDSLDTCDRLARCTRKVLIPQAVKED